MLKLLLFQRQIKRELLPSCNHVSAIVWLHPWDFNDMAREKAKWKQHKDVMCCFEQILEAES